MNYKHGHAVNGKVTKEYRAWASMHDRCSNPRVKEYKYYGARGITVCREWSTFRRFYADMGDSPPGTSIERRDNDKGYSKDNCKWATKKEQMANRRNTIWVEHNGERKPLSVWAQELGLSDGTLYSRVKRGYSIGHLLDRPTLPASLTLGGVTKTICQWALEHRMSHKTIKRRLARGVPPEEVFQCK